MYYKVTYPKKKQISLHGMLFACFTVFIIFIGNTAKAQVPVNFEQPVAKDSIAKPRIRWRDKPIRKTRARLELGAVVVIPWIYDKLLGKDYANITWETTKRNVKPSSWEWDDDFFKLINLVTRFMVASFTTHSAPTDIHFGNLPLQPQ
ncbi:hypothetical protein [Mucilaginibacter antarcticus]|uniref:hypothetical protein n=1 Tax=Mucilaginibacter antarcticus TaxID=1855725 RepID=UPI003630D206